MEKLFTIAFINLTVILLLAGCSSSRVSFIVASDIHFQGADLQQLQIFDTVIGLMNNSERLVRDAAGTSVSKPFGVFITGDLTDNGTVEQWDEFVRVFGLNGEGNLELPVYETFGNHDGVSGGVVREGIRERNTRRKGIYMISDNGLHYVVMEE